MMNLKQIDAIPDDLLFDYHYSASYEEEYQRALRKYLAAKMEVRDAFTGSDKVYANQKLAKARTMLELVLAD